MENISNKMRMIMGLDVSTRCVGMTVAAVGDDGKANVLVVTHLRPKVPSKVKGTESLFMKSDVISHELSKYKDYGITDVVIEEPLIGSNNSETVATLLRFNGMISQSVYDRLGVVPAFISSYDARKFACPHLMTVRRFKKNGDAVDEKKIRSSIRKSELVLFGDYPFDCAKKLILWNHVSEKYPGIQWQYKKNGDLKDENFDASDSLVCVLGFLNKEKYGETPPAVESWSENDRMFTYTVDFCGQKMTHTVEKFLDVNDDGREAYTNC